MTFTLDNMISELKKMYLKEKSLKTRVLIQNVIDSLVKLKEEIPLEKTIE